MKTYYSLLQIPKDASIDEIKSAYRTLASRYHPDVNSDPDAEEIFKLLNRAHKVLVDPDKRRDYDDLISSDNIYRNHPGDQVVESSGAFSAYSNILANAIFFGIIALALTSFSQWLAEIKDIFWNQTTITAISLGGAFGLLVGFNGNFNAKELFGSGYKYFKIAFWLVALTLLVLVGYLNYSAIKTLF